VAARSGQLAYSLFYNNGYEIQRIDAPTTMAGTPPSEALAALGAGVLPPRKSDSGYVAALLADVRFGLPSTTASFRVTSYQPHLSLDYVEPAAVGVGVSSFGTVAGGGTALHFSDMLNFHELTTAFETSTSGEGFGDLARNFTGMAQYLNQRHRWNWGFVGGQIPFVSGAVAQGVAAVDNQPALVQQEILFWQINRQAAAIAQYPFSRAQRVEFAAGWQNISFTERARTQAFAPDGSLLLDQTQSSPTPTALNMANGTAALVYDTSVFGGTGPVMGQRYRLEGGIAGGSLNFSTLLADYRRYFSLARPLSVAGRILHYGRYGGDAEDPRLSDFFLGYPELVRGYSPGSFSAQECGPALQQNGSCPIFDQMVGSRIAVANAELRLALLGPLGVIPSFKFPPVTMAGFFDGGVAWTSASKASFLGGPRSGISSEGVALQINLLGFAVGQVSLAHANDRPLKPWIWQFSLLPGF
ncbi:MAG: BamA/TamA family outer membrane protein, partial [Candidatus Angelobacter sp.]